MLKLSNVSNRAAKLYWKMDCIFEEIPTIWMSEKTCENIALKYFEEQEEDFQEKSAQEWISEWLEAELAGGQEPLDHFPLNLLCSGLLAFSNWEYLDDEDLQKLAHEEKVDSLPKNLQVSAIISKQNAKIRELLMFGHVVVFRRQNFLMELLQPQFDPGFFAHFDRLRLNSSLSEVSFESCGLLPVEEIKKKLNHFSESTDLHLDLDEEPPQRRI